VQATDALTFDITQRSSTPSDSVSERRKLKACLTLQHEHIEERFAGALDLPAQWSRGRHLRGLRGTGKSSIAGQLFELRS
jgi:tRNA(Met) C34 N-acetyltransferase TmcA